MSVKTLCRMCFGRVQLGMHARFKLNWCHAFEFAFRCIVSIIHGCKWINYAAFSFPCCQILRSFGLDFIVAPIYRVNTFWWCWSITAAGTRFNFSVKSIDIHITVDYVENQSALKYYFQNSLGEFQIEADLNACVIDWICVQWMEIDLFCAKYQDISSSGGLKVQHWFRWISLLWHFERVYSSY